MSEIQFLSLQMLIVLLAITTQTEWHLTTNTRTFNGQRCQLVILCHPSLTYIFSVRHVMQCTVLLSQFCLSVRPSVRQTRFCDKTKQCTADILIPHETAITLVF